MAEEDNLFNAFLRQNLNTYRKLVSDRYERPLSSREVLGNTYDPIYHGSHSSVLLRRGTRDALIVFRGTDFTSLKDADFLTRLWNPRLEHDIRHGSGYDNQLSDIDQILQEHQLQPFTSATVVGHSAGGYKARLLRDKLRQTLPNTSYIGLNSEIPPHANFQPLDELDAEVRTKGEKLTAPPRRQAGETGLLVEYDIPGFRRHTVDLKPAALKLPDQFTVSRFQPLIGGFKRAVGAIRGFGNRIGTAFSAFGQKIAQLASKVTNRFGKPATSAESPVVIRPSTPASLQPFASPLLQRQTSPITPGLTTPPRQLQSPPFSFSPLAESSAQGAARMAQLRQIAATPRTPLRAAIPSTPGTPFFTPG